MNQKIRTLAGYIAILLDIGVMLVAYSIANILRFNTPRAEHIISSADYVVLLWLLYWRILQLHSFSGQILISLQGIRQGEAFLVLKQYIIVSLCVMAYFYIMKLGGDFSRLQLGYFFIISVVGTIYRTPVIKKGTPEKIYDYICRENSLNNR